MKYRCLTDEELQELETELVQFLIANGVDGPDWKRLNEVHPDRALRLVEIFSEQVFDKIISDAKFMLHIGPQSLFAFHCEADLIHLMGLKVVGKTVNLQDEPYLSQPAKIFEQIPAANLQLFHQSKAYQPDRSLELFRMLENNIHITDGQTYRLLEELYEKSAG
ncbi:MAG: DUF6495 family protein [Bacteroidota bacterium]